MGNSLAKICFCYKEDYNDPPGSDDHQYSKITDEHGLESPEHIKAHQHYSSNKYVSHSHKDHSSLKTSDNRKRQDESKGINNQTNEEDSKKRYYDNNDDDDDDEDEEVEIFEEESGGIVERKVKKNNIKHNKVCLLKRGHLSAITEEDDQIRDSMLLSKRERYSKIYSIVNNTNTNNNNSSLIVEEQEHLEEGGVGLGMGVDEIRQTNERNTIKIIMEEMKAVEAMGIEAVIDELLNIISNDQPMSDIQEGMYIPDVLPEYESICKNGLKRLLLMSVSDLTKEGFVQEYVDPAEKSGVVDCQKYQEWLREALFEANIKAKNIESQKGKVDIQYINNKEKVLVDKQIDKEIANDKVSSSNNNNTDSTNGISDINGTNLDSVRKQEQSRQLQETEGNNNNNNNKKSSPRITAQIISNDDNYNVSSINNNENSFMNESRDSIEQNDIKLVVSSNTKNITDDNNNNTTTTVATISPTTTQFYSRILMKPVIEDKYKYFHIKSEYNLHGIDAKKMIDCMVNEQWSRENNQSIDVFESLGTFKDYKLIYISYKKVLMTSPRDFLYLKCNKKVSSSLYLTLQVSIELDQYPVVKDKERAIVKLGGMLLKDNISDSKQNQQKESNNDNGNMIEQQNSELSVVSYTESNLKLTLNHKLTLKPTVNEIKKYIQRLQHFVKDKQDKQGVIQEQKQ